MKMFLINDTKLKTHVKAVALIYLVLSIYCLICIQSQPQPQRNTMKSILNNTFPYFTGDTASGLQDNLPVYLQ